MARPTNQQLSDQLKEANARLDAAARLEAQNTTALEEAQRQIAEHNAALAAAQAQVDAAQTAATDAAAAAQAAIAANGQGQVANGPAPAPQLIPKPHLAPGETMNIQGAMGINKTLYGEIRYRIHGLVHAANLEWQQDFRNQDAEKLACMFKAAALEFPVLKNYTHHWATAAIASRYMQNIRRHARVKGILPRKSKYNRRQNTPA